jgi:hypothetical protein
VVQPFFIAFQVCHPSDPVFGRKPVQPLIQISKYIIRFIPSCRLIELVKSRFILGQVAESVRLPATNPTRSSLRSSRFGGSGYTAKPSTRSKCIGGSLKLPWARTGLVCKSRDKNHPKVSPQLFENSIAGSWLKSVSLYWRPIFMTIS